MGQKRKASESRHDAPPRDSKFAEQTATQKKTHRRGGGGKSEQKEMLKFKPRADWHAAELPPVFIPESVNSLNTPSTYTIEALKSHALTLLESENTLASTTIFQSSSHKFMSTIMATGTLEDRVSALTLAIQESPLHNMKAFGELVNLARKRSRNHALMALAALKDLLGQGSVLPGDRKLRWFGKQPGIIGALQGQDAKWYLGQKLPGDIQEIHLLSWIFEDWLKKEYFELLQILEKWCNDEIDFARNRAMTYSWELLKQKPEQEENLLRLLINKLGDTEKKVASRASYLLLQLQVTHPNMKEIIIKSVESDVLFRPGQSAHAKYYAIITLNQTVLSTREQELARKLLDIYFTLFKSLLQGSGPHQKWNGEKINSEGQKMNRKAIKRAKEQGIANKAEEELKEKMIAQVLTGVNRAFPFAESDEASFEAQLETLYRVTHSSNFNTSIQALILIQMISTSTHLSADRFYRTLYESLLDPRLATSSKQVMYLNLLYKSLKADLNVKRVKAFMKRLLQVLTLHEPPFVCSVIYLVCELQKVFPSLKAMLNEPEYLEDDEEEHFVDAPEDGETTKESPKAAALPSSAYDPRKRDPLFSNADRSCLWELLPLQAHFHPSVALFGSRLLFSEKMPEKPDPTLHTLMHFLDRFTYRNVRAKGPVVRGVSIMQPLAGAAGTDILIRDRSGARIEAPLNTEGFWDKHRDQVKPDEVFFHQYFNQTGKKKMKVSLKEDEAGEEPDEEENEDQIWKALAESRPEIEGEDEDEMGFSDMDDLLSGDGIGEEEDEDDEEGGVILNLESDDEQDEDGDGNDGAAAGVDDEMDGEDSEMDLDIAELESGEDALIGSDEDIPSDVELPPMAMGEEEEGESNKSRRQKKRKLKHLPVFASAEDYAELIGNDEDEDY